jgi:hypothetical protein
MEEREGWRVMEGRGSDGGGGNGGAGPSLSTVALVVREWGVVVDCGRSPFVGGGLWCPWALVAALFVGAGLSFVGAELSFWAVGSFACGATFVGGGLLIVSGLFVGARGSLVGGYCVRGSWQRCLWALDCRSWAPSCRLWAVGLVRVWRTFVGCRLWGRWCCIVCHRR